MRCAFGQPRLSRTMSSDHAGGIPAASSRPLVIELLAGPLAERRRAGPSTRVCLEFGVMDLSNNK
jgi:hypothetical protein